MKETSSNYYRPIVEYDHPTLKSMLILFFFDNSQQIDKIPNYYTFKRQPHKMVKHTQNICQLIPKNTKYWFLKKYNSRK